MEPAATGHPIRGAPCFLPHPLPSEQDPRFTQFWIQDRIAEWHKGPADAFNDRTPPPGGQSHEMKCLLGLIPRNPRKRANTPCFVGSMSSNSNPNSRSPQRGFGRKPLNRPDFLSPADIINGPALGIAGLAVSRGATPEAGAVALCRANRATPCRSGGWGSGFVPHLTAHRPPNASGFGLTRMSLAFGKDSSEAEHEQFAVEAQWGNDLCRGTHAALRADDAALRLPKPAFDRSMSTPPIHADPHRRFLGDCPPGSKLLPVWSPDQAAVHHRLLHAPSSRAFTRSHNRGVQDRSTMLEFTNASKPRHVPTSKRLSVGPSKQDPVSSAWSPVPSLSISRTQSFERHEQPSVH